MGERILRRGKAGVVPAGDRKDLKVYSTTRSETRRRLVARVAAAGALAVIPLAAVAVPASAQPEVPGVTEVRHDHRDRFDCDEPGFWDDWNHSPGRWDDCRKNRHWDDPLWRFWHDNKPRGLFGSS